MNLWMLKDTRGFIECWREELKSGLGYEDAYWKLEDIYFDAFGEWRYSGYDSFKQVMYYIHNKDNADKTD
jgi:hypothetical protein